MAYDFTSTQSGNWSASSTCGGAGVPVAGDSVTIGGTSSADYAVMITGSDTACATLNQKGN